MLEQFKKTEAEQITIIITPQGEVVSPWWSLALEDLLKELGVKGTYPGEVFWGEKHLCG